MDRRRKSAAPGPPITAFFTKRSRLGKIVVTFQFNIINVEESTPVSMTGSTDRVTETQRDCNPGKLLIITIKIQLSVTLVNFLSQILTCISFAEKISTIF